MGNLDGFARIAMLPVIGLLWLVWTGPALAWAHLYPALKAHNKHRLVWLPWFLIVTYLILDRVIFDIARKPDPTIVFRKLEQLRVLVGRLVDTLLFAVPRWVLASTKDDPALGVLGLLAISVVGIFLTSFILFAP